MIRLFHSQELDTSKSKGKFTYNHRRGTGLGYDLFNPLEVFNIINLVGNVYGFEEPSQIFRRGGLIHHHHYHKKIEFYGKKDRVEEMLEDITAQMMDISRRDRKIKRRTSIRPKFLNDNTLITVSTNVSILEIKKEEALFSVLEDKSIDALNSDQKCITTDEKIIVTDNKIIDAQKTPQKCILPAKSRRRMIAPDGFVPNSLLFKDVARWKEEQGILDSGMKEPFFIKKKVRIM